MLPALNLDHHSGLGLLFLHRLRRHMPERPGRTGDRLAIPGNNNFLPYVHLECPVYPNFKRFPQKVGNFFQGKTRPQSWLSHQVPDLRQLVPGSLHDVCDVRHGCYPTGLLKQGVGSLTNFETAAVYFVREHLHTLLPIYLCEHLVFREFPDQTSFKLSFGMAADHFLHCNAHPRSNRYLCRPRNTLKTWQQSVLLHLADRRPCAEHPVLHKLPRCGWAYRSGTKRG